MSMSEDAFREDVMGRGVIHEPAEAEGAIRSTLEALAELLAPADATAIAAALPPGLASVIVRRPRGSAQPLGDLYARIAASEGVSLGRAVEQVGAVCQAVAEALDVDGRVLLQRRLTPEWAQLFALEERAPAPDGPPGAPGTAPGHGHTLATGRPGSRRPLSEARSPGAQTESVVASENPHAKTKLSSGAPAAAEAPLASARPGAQHPLAGAKDERSGRD